MDEGKTVPESTVTPTMQIDSTSDSNVFYPAYENATIISDADFISPDSVGALSAHANAHPEKATAQDQERYSNVMFEPGTNQDAPTIKDINKFEARSAPPAAQQHASLFVEIKKTKEESEQPLQVQQTLLDPSQSEAAASSVFDPDTLSRMVAGDTEKGVDFQMEQSESQSLPEPPNTSNQASAATSTDIAPPTAPVAGVFTQTAPIIIPDFDTTDEAYAESTTTSYVTSIKSEISRGVLENERLYPSYGQHKYGMPVDEDELDRMDLQHRKYELVIGDKHFLAPVGPTPQKILDLGTGTGIWALDVADMYPSAQVIGVDIAPIQPKWVASNCQFEIDDVEETWTYKPNSFDFIHFRDPLYSIRDWPKLMRQCYKHLKPGGWCELACIYPVPKCDDGSMPPDSGFKVICDKFMEASALFGAPADSPLYFTQYFRNAGFQTVTEHIFKVPSSPWPKDKRLKQIGALEMTNVVQGATAFGLRAFEQTFGWSKEQTELVMVNFRRDVRNRHYHQYCQYFVVYGQKAPDYSGHA